MQPSRKNNISQMVSEKSKVFLYFEKSKISVKKEIA